MNTSPAHEERFWSKVEVADCWTWTAAKAGKGYGKYTITRNGKTTYPYAHRHAWESLVGPIPDGMTLDHLCKNRLCVNPDHLEVVDGVTNAMRGSSPPALNARKTHCPRGHEYTEENVRRTKSGRLCIQCQRAHDKVRPRRGRR